MRKIEVLDFLRNFNDNDFIVVFDVNDNVQVEQGPEVSRDGLCLQFSGITRDGQAKNAKIESIRSIHSISLVNVEEMIKRLHILNPHFLNNLLKI